MTARNLRDHLKEYYGTKSPSAEILERVEALARLGKSRSSRSRAGSRRPSGVMAAGATVVAVAAAAALFLVRGGLLEGGSVERAVVREIVLNHSKDLALEFRADDFEALRASMDKLDFVLVRPRGARIEGLRVLGGRYCSVQGRLAAQIRLEDRAGRIHTLYETSAGAELARVSETEAEVGGARVILWRDAGLLFGLAGPLAPDRQERTEEGEL